MLHWHMGLTSSCYRLHVLCWCKQHLQQKACNTLQIKLSHLTSQTVMWSSFQHLLPPHYKCNTYILCCHHIIMMTVCDAILMSYSVLTHFAAEHIIWHYFSRFVCHLWSSQPSYFAVVFFSHVMHDFNNCKTICYNHESVWTRYTISHGVHA